MGWGFKRILWFQSHLLNIEGVNIIGTLYQLRPYLIRLQIILKRLSLCRLPLDLLSLWRLPKWRTDLGRVYNRRLFLLSLCRLHLWRRIDLRRVYNRILDLDNRGWRLLLLFRRYCRNGDFWLSRTNRWLLLVINLLLGQLLIGTHVCLKVVLCQLLLLKEEVFVLRIVHWRSLVNRVL